MVGHVLERGALLIFGCLCSLALMPDSFGQECKQCSKGKVDIPITLAAGTVRTPPFTSRGRSYLIAIVIQRSSVSKEDLTCKFGELEIGQSASGTSEKCGTEPWIEAKWRVLEDGHETAHGSDGGFSEHVEMDGKIVRRYIGDFVSEPGHEYVVEVMLTKDGSALDFANPHLVVMQPESSF
jgi:hypothetical protein